MVPGNKSCERNHNSICSIYVSSPVLLGWVAEVCAGIFFVNARQWSEVGWRVIARNLPFHPMYIYPPVGMEQADDRSSDYCKAAFATTSASDSGARKSGYPGVLSL
jgi:hypothetical protein